jgi:hypothetical protein
VVERTAGILLEGRSCLRRYKILVIEKVDWEDSRESLAAIALANAGLEELGWYWSLFWSSRGGRVGQSWIKCPCVLQYRQQFEAIWPFLLQLWHSTVGQSEKECPDIWQWRQNLIIGTKLENNAGGNKFET